SPPLKRCNPILTARAPSVGGAAGVSPGVSSRVSHLEARADVGLSRESHGARDSCNKLGLLTPELRMIRCTLLAILIVSGALLAWRAIAGPILIHNPLNLESCFGLAAVLLILTSASTEKDPAPLPSNDIPALFGIAALVFIAYAPILNSY